MEVSKSIMEESPFTPFHKRLTINSAGGPFIDGYILSIIGIALTQMGTQFHLNAFWSGLIGASALAGIFIGGFFLGYLTDLIGRKVMYIAGVALITVFSILQMFAHTPLELCILRFVIGIAIGADYPIATSLLAEFAPRKQRGLMLGSLILMWYIGATVADVVGYFLLGMGDNSWKWMLGSGAIPSLILLLMRLGTPESPRWLISKGRFDKARVIVKRVFGQDADIDGLIEESTEKTRFSKMFERGYLKRTMFVSFFWMFQIVPLFAIYTFGPQILDAFHLGKGNIAFIGEAVISFFFLLGCIPALFLVNTMGRRPLIIWCFAFMTLGLLILGVFPNASIWVIIGGFAIYAIFSGGPNVLDFIYPNELFPTEIRASAVGVATSISRIGSFIGTFVLPYSLDKIGIGSTMMIGAGISLLGLIISIAWAPETRGLTLAETSAVKGPEQKIPARKAN
ncbi:MFS transporter [Bacillus salipaludis]|uniref:MFS transporter n=1 Tax=Bacillus salipaludis TaxID=2547811 RepID=UPI002E1B91A1|nr:MFS transporter [Bacillus salipaludis]